ncbi:MAG: hypothetical protein U0074_10745 [Kouleothrix sp.]
MMDMLPVQPASHFARLGSPCQQAADKSTDRHVCRSGNHSTTTSQPAGEPEGFTQLRNVQGGMIAWGRPGTVAYGQ